MQNPPLTVSGPERRRNAIGNLYITNHAEDRFRERVGLPKRLVTKGAKAALERGLTHAETTGHLRKYLDKVFLTYGTADNVRVYSGNVWIFAGGFLITIYPLPPKLRKIAVKLLREKKEGKSNAGT